jgi:type IV pilus assembly protein PilM
MGLLKQKTRSVVGLDIEPGFVAAAEFTHGSSSSPKLVKAATESLGPGLFHEGEVVDVDGLSERLRAFFREHELPKRVRLGVASQKIAVRVLELPPIENAQELEAAIRFQAQEELPMPLEQAVLDHRVLERINDGDSSRMRVLVVGARADSVNHLLAVARRAGLNPELVDLSAFAMIRALYVPREATPAPQPLVGATGEAVATDGLSGESSGHLIGDPDVDGAGGEHALEGPTNGAAAAAVVTDPQSLATVYCYIGGLTNLAIGVGTNCVFNRVLHNGIESMAATLAERKGLTLDHSREWLRYVGLERDLGNIEGEQEIITEAREVLDSGARRIADEVRLSMEYYHSTVPDAPRVETAVMAGPGIAIAGLDTLFEQELGLSVEARSMGQVDVEPGALDGVDSAHLTIATGLALDEVPS